MEKEYIIYHSPQCSHIDQNKFLVRGVVYQADDFERHQNGINGQIDMVNDERLERLGHDIELFKELGLNTIYVCTSTSMIREGRERIR